MRLLKRLLRRQPAISQAHVTRRAMVVIDKVIFDVGVDALVGGAFVLDKTFRLRFIGVAQWRRHGVIASVQVSDVAESVLFCAMRGQAPLAAEVIKAHSACLAQALVRELGSQSEAFRALPAFEA